MKESSKTDLVTFSSGATSGGERPPFRFMTFCGIARGAARFEYGNRKHERGTNILADANWLKAFHARDVLFFQNRMAHAMTHLFREMTGDQDSRPGGNWGAIMWAAEILSFVEDYDPELYKAIIGKHETPLEARVFDCPCPRCQ